MIYSANIRRGKPLCRIFLSQHHHVLGAPRRPLGRLAHLACMNETMHPFPGLEPVLTTSELAADLGVPVQTLHDLRHTGRGPRRLPCRPRTALPALRGPGLARPTGAG